MTLLNKMRVGMFIWCVTGAAFVYAMDDALLHADNSHESSVAQDISSIDAEKDNQALVPSDANLSQEVSPEASPEDTQTQSLNDNNAHQEPGKVRTVLNKIFSETWSAISKVDLFSVETPATRLAHKLFDACWTLASVVTVPFMAYKSLVHVKKMITDKGSRTRHAVRIGLYSTAAVLAYMAIQQQGLLATPVVANVAGI